MSAARLLPTIYLIRYGRRTPVDGAAAFAKGE